MEEATDYAVWKLQDAKAQFSKVVRDALAEGPQYVTKHGQPAVVVLSEEAYKKLLEKERPEKEGPKQSLIEFLLNTKIEGGFEIERIQDYPREIDL